MKNVLILTGIIMILPITLVYGQIEPDPNQPTGPVTNIDDLNRGHDIITQLMTDHANGNFERFENQVINLAFVDPDNNTLVIGFDPIMYVLDIKPNTGDLLTGIPTDIVYSIHELLSEDQDPIQRYHNLYEHRCVNSLSIFCEKLARELNINQTQDRPALPTTLIIFSDKFQNGLKKWNKTGDFRAKISDESSRYPTGWSNSNKVLESGKCNSNNNNTCVISLKKNLDLTKYENITLSFDYFIDHLNTGKYGHLEIYSNNKWNTFVIFNHNSNNRWNDLLLYLDNYKSSTFNLRFIVDSNKNKEISFDNIVIKGIVIDSDGDGILNNNDKCPGLVGLTILNGCPDTEAPIFYSDFSSNYEYITNDKYFYPVIAIDNVDGVTPITCNPPSGSILQSSSVTSIYKTTNITCTTTDSYNNTNTKTFSFNYKETNHVDLYGGMQHLLNFYYEQNDDMNASFGTITIGAETTNGTKGVVVAGHSVLYNVHKQSYSLDYHMDHYVLDQGKKSQIGFGPAIDSKNFSVDAAFIPLLTNVDINPYQVKMRNGTVFNVTQSSMADTPINATINAYGFLTNSQGMLLYKNVTKVDGGGIYHNMGIFTSDVIIGDSGGPIIYHNDNKNKLIGSVHGATCIIQNIANQDDIDVRDMPSLCPNNNEDWTYKVFTPWEYIKEDLNIK